MKISNWHSVSGGKQRQRSKNMLLRSKTLNGNRNHPKNDPFWGAAN